MAIGKFDLSKIRAERVTQSHADNDMEFIDKMNSAKQGHRKLVKLPYPCWTPTLIRKNVILYRTASMRAWQTAWHSWGR